MQRVVILGRGAAGKSTLADALASRLGLPVEHLDERFWKAGRIASPPSEWCALQEELISRPRWILDGDLGPHDVPGVRLAAADTVVVLDLSLARCFLRALRRSRERADFWRWVARYRRECLPAMMSAIATHAPTADVHVLRSPRAVRRFLALVERRA